MAEKLQGIYPAGATVMAPLSGYTDLPYRRSLRRCGCRYAFTEMIDAASLAYARERAGLMLRRGEEETFLGVQLVGGDPEFLRIAIDALNEYDFDVLDFNLGCPMPKVAKKDAGAELGRHIDRALARFALFRERSRHPLSAKIRILSETDPAPTVELVRGLAGLGARTVTIHGRIKDAIYSGPMYFAMIRAAGEAAPEVQILGNGGIMNRRDAETMRRETGCAGIMLARGAMGNPWLFREITEGDAYRPPTITELRTEIERQVTEMAAWYGEESALCLARKIVHDYLRGRGFPGPYRDRASHLRTLDGLRRLLADAPAVHAENYFRQAGDGRLNERLLRPD